MNRHESVPAHAARTSGRVAALVTAVIAALTVVAACDVEGGTVAVYGAREFPAATASVAARDETTPVGHRGDSADDPAIWIHPKRPSRSVVIGNDKRGAIEVYNLSGHRVQRIHTGGYTTNVDVRQQVRIAGRTRDIVATTHDGIRFYAVNRSTGLLTGITDTPRVNPAPDGLCLYLNQGGALYVFVTREADGVVRQYRVSDGDRDGRLGVSLVRTFDVGSAVEGCAADDGTGAFYVSEEDVALWRYEAAPDGGTSRTAVDTTGRDGHLAADVEGVTVVRSSGGGGYVIVSAQNVAAPRDSYFAVYRRSASNAFVATFRVVGGSRADGCQRTDGIAAYAGRLGSGYPRGLFVCQDNTNTAPGSRGHQNFKFVRLDRAVDLS